MRKDLTGQRFGRLVVLQEGERASDGAIRWKCRCDCGAEKQVRTTHLTTGSTRSCGCLHYETFLKNKQKNYKHGHTHSRLYHIWSGIIQRCTNSRNPKYHRYGERGIEVCMDWRNDFRSFYDWAMSNGYADNLSIDRIDNDGNYEPDNCRWATLKEQANNVSYNLIYEYKGERKTLKQWAEEYKIHYNTLYTRIKKENWEFERALITPIRKKGDE